MQRNRRGYVNHRCQCQPKADFWPWHEGDISELQASEQGSGLSWRSVNESVVGLCQDSQVREHGLMWMRRLAAAQRSALVNGETPQPFFLAVGLRKPHLPFVAPSSFFDLYPAADTQLAPNPYAPWDMPAVAYASEELQSYSDVAARATPAPSMRLSPTGKPSSWCGRTKRR